MTDETASPPERRARWSIIGPGVVVVTATGVGAGDLVATLIAGSRFGYALLWMLNSARVPVEWRSGWLSNLMLGAAALLFAVLAGRERIGLF